MPTAITITANTCGLGLRESVTCERVGKPTRRRRKYKARCVPNSPDSSVLRKSPGFQGFSARESPGVAFGTLTNSVWPSECPKAGILPAVSDRDTVRSRRAAPEALHRGHTNSPPPSIDARVASPCRPRRGLPRHPPSRPVRSRPGPRRADGFGCLWTPCGLRQAAGHGRHARTARAVGGGLRATGADRGDVRRGEDQHHGAPGRFARRPPGTARPEDVLRRPGCRARRPRCAGADGGVLPTGPRWLLEGAHRQADPRGGQRGDRRLRPWACDGL